MQPVWEYCIVEWVWDQHSIRCDLPGGRGSNLKGSYPEVVEMLTELGSEGWEVATCAGVGNWVLWTLKRASLQ